MIRGVDLAVNVGFTIEKRLVVQAKGCNRETCRAREVGGQVTTSGFSLLVPSEVEVWNARVNVDYGCAQALYCIVPQPTAMILNDDESTCNTRQTSLSFQPRRIARDVPPRRSDPLPGAFDLPRSPKSFKSCTRRWIYTIHLSSHRMLGRDWRAVSNSLDEYLLRTT